ncbi:hypothetical protein ARAM_004546 [Aspergillus rambellii]|uniref:MARVEL domain-containing protein n=1 Tax=Aspergillus rambellii TaxID=308745 RepID=A0A0F8WD94_9EURO|nr:hypothetical protein ARAM_004546 [Aspergillus rambellii]
MRSKSVKPSDYPAFAFHTIRVFALLSAIIVAIILSVFIYNLHSANQKLPWAFLVLIITAFLAILNYTLTTITHCCYGLSPRLSLTTNSIVLLLWLASLVLLAWSMSHTILTACTTTYWATSTGISVCRVYKALFAFTILGTLTYLAAVALDIIVHQRHTRLGEYDPMAVGLAEYKPGRHDRMSSGGVGEGLGPEQQQQQQHLQEDRIPLVHHQRQVSEDVDAPYPRPLMHVPPPPSYTSANVDSSLEAQEEYSDTAPAWSQRRGPRMRFSAYNNPSYDHSGEQTSYDPAGYR